MDFGNNLDKPKALYDFNKRPRRQDIKKNDYLYKENGSIYITNVDIFKKFKNRLGGEISTYVMDEQESYEIDTFFDLKLLEMMIRDNIEKL